MHSTAKTILAALALVVVLVLGWRYISLSSETEIKNTERDRQNCLETNNIWLDAGSDKPGACLILPTTTLPA
mgnify:CR=1 FL=1